MAKEKDKKAKELTPAQKKIVEVSLDIQFNNAFESNNVSYITKVLAMVSLPYKKQSTNQYQRTNGDYTVTFVNTSGGDLPYGRYPRLIIIWLITQVMQKKTQVIDLGSSLNEFMDVFELSTDGRTMKRFKKAAEDLFDTNINIKRTIEDSNNIGHIKSDIKIASTTVTFWNKKNPDQLDLFNLKLKLTSEFYNDIISTAFPIDTRAVKNLTRNIALDLYIFLVSRVHRLNTSKTKTEAFIPIRDLHSHIGANYENSKIGLNNFQRDTKSALQEIKQLWPQLNAELIPGRLHVIRSYPHVAYRSPTVDKPVD